MQNMYSLPSFPNTYLLFIFTFRGEVLRQNMCFGLGQVVTQRGRVTTGFRPVSLPESAQAVRKRGDPVYIYPVWMQHWYLAVLFFLHCCVGLKICETEVEAYL